MLTQLLALVMTDPDAATRAILQAVTEAQGDRSLAAERLGVSHRTLLRLIGRLDLWRVLDALAVARQWPVQLGHKRGPLTCRKSDRSVGNPTPTKARRKP